MVSPSTDSVSALAYVRCAVMPSEQPLAQDLMHEAFNSNGSHVERFLSPTILSVPPDLDRVHENTATELNEMVQAGREICECTFKLSFYLHNYLYRLDQRFKDP